MTTNIIIFLFPVLICDVTSWAQNSHKYGIMIHTEWESDDGESERGLSHTSVPLIIQHNLDSLYLHGQSISNDLD